MDKKQLPDYESFLLAVDYNPEDVEKYFDKIERDFDEELLSLLDLSDKELSKIYQNYEEKIKDYEQIKVDVLTKYFRDYESLNVNYEKEVASLENDYYARKSELQEIINQENELISKIKYDFLMKFYEKKKSVQENIKKITQSTDKEFEKHANIIFNAKEYLLSNNTEYFNNANSHLAEIRKTIKFLEELNEYTKNLKQSVNALKTTDTIRTIDIYTEYINDQKTIALNIAPLSLKYNELEQGFISLSNELTSRFDALNKEILSLNKNISDKEKDFEKDVEAINTYFKNEIEKETDKDVIKTLLHQQAVLLKKVAYDKNHLLIESHIDLELLRSQKENINNLKLSLSALNSDIKNSYIDQLEKNSQMLGETYDTLLLILNDEKNAVLQFEGDTSDSREIIQYFEDRFNKLELNTRLEILDKYEKYLVKNIQDNQKLNNIAFTILTNEEVVKLKLLDLKREFLTIDDEVQIKKIKYDNDIEEMKELIHPSLVIKNTQTEIALLKKDYEIDKSIALNELNNSISILDLRKNIDVMRYDYMCAYARLDNVINIINAKNTNSDQIAELKTQIQLQKILEIFLFESISRKNQYEVTMERYHKYTEELDTETQARLRYLNNVLEIERDKFQEKKESLKQLYNSLKSLVYPEMIDVKKQAGKLIIECKKIFARLEEAEKNEVKYNQDSLVHSINKTKNALLVTDEAIDSLFNKEKDNISIYKNVDPAHFTSFASSIFDGLVSVINQEIKNINCPKLKEVTFNTKKYNHISTLFTKKFKSSKSNRSYVSSFTYLIKSLKKMAESLYQKYLHEMKKVLSPSDEELLFALDSYEEVRKAILTEKVINTTLHLNSFYDDIEEIEKARRKVSDEINAQISETKKNYIQTVKSIEDEYKIKIDQLDRFIAGVEEKRTKDKDELNRILAETFEKLENDTSTSIKKNNEESEAERKNAKQSAASLSKEIESVNNSLEVEKKKNEEKNVSYRKTMEEKAKTAFYEAGKAKEKNEDELTQEEKNKEDNRNAYFEKIIIDSLEVKENYQKNKDELEKQIDKEKIEKTIEYGKIFEEVKNDSLNSIDTIASPIVSFDEVIKKFNTDMLVKVDALTKEMTKESSDNFSNSIKHLEELEKSLNKEDKK